MNESGFDIIGDIHGHGTALINLLEHLGYRESCTGYSHPLRQALFLGDFIDRGEDLAEHRMVLNTVMPMVRNGHAMAVMGNHEFNALAFHTEINGKALRPHSGKNVGQHQGFLNEYQGDADAKRDVLDFFYELPLWLDLDGIRVIHACWHSEHIDVIKQTLPDGLLTPEALRDASTEGTPLFEAIETLLKGVEVQLPDGITFRDKDNHSRSAVRVRWWDRSAEFLGDVVLPPSIDIGHVARQPIPAGIPRYAEDAVPCFVGHYWLKGEPAVLTSNIACVDYSVASGGPLVAYRWNGEQVLDDVNFTFVGQLSRCG